MGLVFNPLDSLLGLLGLSLDEDVAVLDPEETLSFGGYFAADAVVPPIEELGHGHQHLAVPLLEQRIKPAEGYGAVKLGLKSRKRVLVENIEIELDEECNLRVDAIVEVTSLVIQGRLQTEENGLLEAVDDRSFSVEISALLF